MINMKKELPFTIAPICTFPSINAPLGIALSYDAPKAWFYNKFVQIYGTRYHLYSHYGCFIDGDSSPAACPFITRNVLTRRYVNNSFDTFSDFIIHHINCGYYVYAFLDRYYNEKSEDFMVRHFPHQLLIFGYDTEKEIFLGADFFNAIYKTEEISFNGIEEGYQNYDKTQGTNIGEYPDIITYTYKPCNWDFDFKILISSLEDYLNSIDSTKVFYYWFPQDVQKHFRYGLDYYCILRSLIKDKILDVRAFHILYEHKKMMRLRFGYLKETFQLDFPEAAAYKEMEYMSQVIRNLIIKHNLSEQKNIFQKLIVQLDKIESCEREILPELVNKLIRTVYSS